MGKSDGVWNQMEESLLVDLPVRQKQSVHGGKIWTFRRNNVIDDFNAEICLLSLRLEGVEDFLNLISDCDRLYFREVKHSPADEIPLSVDDWKHE